MSDRPRDPGAPQEGTPEYDWLYGNDPGARARAADDDATRVVRTEGAGPEHTRVMPVQPAASDPRRGRAPAAQAGPVGPGGPGAPGAPGAPTGPGGPSRPPRERRRRPRLRLGLLKWVLLLWLVFLLAVPLWAWNKVAKVDAFPEGDRPADQPGTTYLLVGSDSRDELSEEERAELGTGGPVGQRTDTIMLLHTGDGPDLLMSIPRDSIVDIPGRGQGKVNAAFAYGGPQLLVQTLESETGIRIDHYVQIGFGGFVGMVDAVGGIEICPKQAMKDPKANLDIAKGCQEVDGKTALGYARSRYTSQLGDIDRARHQREVVGAVGAAAKSPWTFINPVRYFRLADASAGSFAISEGTGPIALGRFALAMSAAGGGDSLTCGVPIRDLAVTWDEQRSQEMFDYIASDDTSSIPRSLCTPSGLPR